MKIRSGFVSNSSSSSFLLAGVRLKSPTGIKKAFFAFGGTELDIQEAMTKSWICSEEDAVKELIYDLDCDETIEIRSLSDEGIFVGKMISEGEYSLDSEEVTLDELQSIKEQIETKMGEPVDFKIHVGTYQC